MFLVEREKEKFPVLLFLNIKKECSTGRSGTLLRSYGRKTLLQVALIGKGQFSSCPFSCSDAAFSAAASACNFCLRARRASLRRSFAFSISFSI